MKKMITAIFAITLVLSTASIACAVDTAQIGKVNYTDVTTTNWAYPSIKAMSEKEIVKGYPDGTFKPSGTLSYSEFIKMMVLAAGSDPGNATGVNSVTGQKKHWAQNYYDAAKEKGYFTEKQIHSSQLDSKIPRGDMALVISGALGDSKVEKYDNVANSIRDVTPSTKNEYDIIKAYASGILTGYEDGTFKPEGTLTRGESATVIYRMVDESKRVIPRDKKEEATSPRAIKTGDVGIPSDMISNIDFDEFTLAAKSYTIVKDSSQYRLELKENRGTKWMNSIGLNRIYLVKDGKIAESLPLGANFEKVEGYAEPVEVLKAIYETDMITKADYILSVDGVDKTMLFIINPFKK